MKSKEEIEQLAKDLYPIYSISSNPHQIIEKYERVAFYEGYTQCQEEADTSKVTRFEVIDENGRVYQKWNCKVELSYQDDGKTLKAFISSTI